jgi:hypothetical protein
MENTSTNTYAMINILNKIDIYRSKSIMIMENNISVNYNTATPMIQFKFATRTDAKSGGQWNDNKNAYWFPSFNSLVDLVTQLTSLSAATPNTENALVRFSNPQKMKNLQIRKNMGDNQQLWYIFTYLAGEQGNQLTINCSCTQTEFNGILGYLKNLLTQFPTISQIALLRYDTWFEYVGKNKTISNNKPVTNNNNYKTSYKPSNSQPHTVNMPNNINNIANDINNEFGDEIPF